LSASANFGFPSGAVAQLGARVNGIHEVTGSIPVSSTNSSNDSDTGTIPLASGFVHLFVYSAQPRRAASILATSIFFIDIIASNARLASAPPAASASVNVRGVICQERPQRSLHQPQSLS
jgi:hypothetical protein